MVVWWVVKREQPPNVCGGCFVGGAVMARASLLGPSWVVVSGGVLLSHTLASAVPSALWVLASGFGMGPGVSPTL